MIDTFNFEDIFLYIFSGYQTIIFHSKFVILIFIMPGFEKLFITIFHILLVVVYVNLNVKPLKKFKKFWVPSISCLQLTLLYINYMTKKFIPVVRKSILGIMLPVRTSSLCESILVESLVYFSSLHPRFANLF